MFDYARITVQPPEGWNTLKEFFDDADGSKCTGAFTDWAGDMIQNYKPLLIAAAAQQQYVINQFDQHKINIAEFTDQMYAITNAGEQSCNF